MITTLQAIFPSCIFMKDAKHITKTDYQWFITENNELIGIKKDELTDKDQTLLSAFLTPYHVELPSMTDEERWWTQLVQHGEIPINRSIDKYRFVFFSFPVNQLEPDAFNEAIRDIFTTRVSILWENDHTGIIVEETDEGLSYEQIVDVLISDLYVNIKFYVGPYLYDIKKAKPYYQQLLHDAPTVFHYSTDKVVSYISAIPYLLIDQANDTFLHCVPEIVFHDVLADKELLETVETFIQHNLNISVTAKQLYMHRNSLQYRIDKFIEKTGIDIRQFQAAMTVQFALLIKKQLDL